MNDKAKLDLSKTCKIIVAEQQMISAQLYFFGILVRHKEIMTFTLSLEYSRNQNHLTAIYSMNMSVLSQRVEMLPFLLFAFLYLYEYSVQTFIFQSTIFARILLIFSYKFEQVFTP